MRTWVLLGLASCAGGGRPSPADLDGDVIVMTTASDDYSAGGLAGLSVGDEVVQDVTSIHGDAVVSVLDGAVYVVNRLGMDTVRRLDALDGSAPTWETSVGRGANPHAVGRVGGRLLVTRYEEAEAWWLDPEGGAQTGALDLSDLADGDGIPEMSGLVVDGDRALVALQRLRRDDGWEAEPEGRIAVVSPEGEDGVVERVVTVGPNPALVAHPQGGAVVIADDGLWRVRADGTVQGPVSGVPGLVSLALAEDGTGVGLLRQDADHAVVCLDAWDGEAISTSDWLGVFLSDVLVFEGVAYLAARRSWEDPSIAGGLVRMDAADCATVPDPEDWLRGTFAPYALAVRPR